MKELPTASHLNMEDKDAPIMELWAEIQMTQIRMMIEVLKEKGIEAIIPTKSNRMPIATINGLLIF